MHHSPEHRKSASKLDKTLEQIHHSRCRCETSIVSISQPGLADQLATAPIMGLGTRWDRRPEDIVEDLPKADFVVFKANQASLERSSDELLVGGLLRKRDAF